MSFQVLLEVASSAAKRTKMRSVLLTLEVAEFIIEAKRIFELLGIVVDPTEPLCKD